jgi:hypothetical protein
LLGIAAAYNLGPEVAYSKLNRFYNTVFHRFEQLCNHRVPGGVQVQMFSDSVVMWGEFRTEILDLLQQVYLDLIANNLLLRGALVDGALQKEPRLEARYFRKFLPTNDTLARAVGLEKTVKGARLLIEPRLARKLLNSHPQWLTVEGYIGDVNKKVPLNSVLRRICPSPTGTSYELLYFWSQNPNESVSSTNIEDISDRLKEVAEFQDSYVAKHLRETLKVLKRSEARRRRTERELSRAS